MNTVKLAIARIWNEVYNRKKSYDDFHDRDRGWVILLTHRSPLKVIFVQGRRWKNS